jgi:cytochrome c oxidase subunit 2
MSTGRFRALSSLPLAVVVLPACVGEPVTEQGRAAAGLYDLFTVIAAIIFTIVAALIGWSIVRYRARGDDDTEVLPKQFHANVKLEILWFAIPQAIVIGLFIASVMVLGDVDDRVEEPEVVVQVEAFQWGWRFTYGGDTGRVVESLPNDQAEIVLPIDTPIAFELTSRDVVHSFYVPEFFIKRDVVPGRENRLDVTIDEAGTYTARCAEFCGLLHDRMDLSIRAVSIDDYGRWLTEEAGG